jgi:hypothetical protein
MVDIGCLSLLVKKLGYCGMRPWSSNNRERSSEKILTWPKYIESGERGGHLIPQRPKAVEKRTNTALSRWRRGVEGTCFVL